MTFTDHGHHIPGTPAAPFEDRPDEVVDCGGFRECDQCKREAARAPISSTKSIWSEPGEAWGDPVILE